MGLRATVIKKYEIEYGDIQGFNYGSDALVSLIYEFCDDYFVGDDGYGGNDTNAIWEVNKNEFAYMLNEVKEMSQEELDGILGRRHTNGGWEKEEVVRVLEGFLRETPETEDYVRIGCV